MNKIKNGFKTKFKEFEAGVVKLFIDHPGIEIGIDIMDTIIQRLMLGYAIVLVILICSMFVIVSSTLPEEIKETFSPIISVFITALIIPFFLNFCNHRKENEVKQFENNKELYIELVKILLPIITDKTITKKEKDQLKKYIDEHYTDITLLVKIGNCRTKHLQLQ